MNRMISARITTTVPIPMYMVAPCCKPWPALSYPPMDGASLLRPRSPARREAREAPVQGPVVLHGRSKIVGRALRGAPPVIDALTRVGDRARDVVPDLGQQ